MNEQTNKTLQPKHIIFKLNKIKKRKKIKAWKSQRKKKFSTYRGTNPSIISSCGSADKTICLQCGRPGFNIWVGKTPGEGNSYPLQYPSLKNSMDESLGLQRDGHD